MLFLYHHTISLRQQLLFGLLHIPLTFLLTSGIGCSIFRKSIIALIKYRLNPYVTLHILWPVLYKVLKSHT